MHHALKVQEIVSIISEIMSSGSGRSKSSLVALAMTCRALQGPALDALWSTQNSIVPLLKCMPSDLWQIRRLNRRTKKLAFLRPVFETDWVRVDFYAHRIKAVSFNSQHYHTSGVITQVDPAVIQALWVTSGKRPLLPYLRKLKLSLVVDDPEFIYPRLLLGGPLQSLVLSITARDGDLAQFFLALKESRSSRYLQKLDVSLDWRDLSACDFSLPFRELVCALHHLRELYCGRHPLDAIGLLHIASFPQLQTLQLHNDPRDFLSIHLPRSPFLSLQHLILAIPDQLTHFSELLGSMYLNQLESLTVTLNSVPKVTTADIHLDSHFRTLRDCCSHTRLASLHFQTAYHPRSLEELEWKVTPASISPLLAFVNLVKLDLDIVCPFELDDIILRDMAAAWPKLQLLHLGHGRGWGMMSGITLRGLLPLVASCPDLGSLRIVIDASIVGEADGRSTPNKPRNTNIRALELGDSIIQDDVAVAAFLLEVFPNLSNILVSLPDPYSDFQEASFRRWKDVGLLLLEAASQREKTGFTSGEGSRD